jgi:membrane-associated phospholipid phosphatase
MLGIAASLVLRGRPVPRVLVLVLVALAGRASAAPLSERRPAPQVWAEAALTSAAFAGAVAIEATRGEHGGRWDWEPSVDTSARRNFNNGAAQVSNLTGALSLALPLVGQFAAGFDPGLANALMMYAEAHAANLLLVTATKEIVRRPRPYTHSDEPAVQRFAREQGSEAYVSFYSGHASTAFTAAVAGSLLYAGRTRDPWSRHFMWGTEMLLAGTTAQLRVRAGRHYRTDIWVGSAVGTALGVAVPALHGAMPRLSASELGVAGGGLLLGLVGGELVDPCRLLGCLAPGAPAPEPPAPEGPGSAAARSVNPGSSSSGLQWSLTPIAGAQGAGLQFSAEW